MRFDFSLLSIYKLPRYIILCLLMFAAFGLFVIVTDRVTRVSAQANDLPPLIENDFTRTLRDAQGRGFDWSRWLPACPCMEPVDNDEWSRAVFFNNINRYHPGATTSYRSSSGFGPQGQHGQQCTYDENRMLITGGSAAGTPDYWRATPRYLWQHIDTDVSGWLRLGWRIYNQYWQPSPGRNENGQTCPSRIITPITLNPGYTSEQIANSTPYSLPNAFVGQRYTQNISAQGARSYRICVSSLPTGLTVRGFPLFLLGDRCFNGQITITGSPSRAGVFQFVVYVYADNDFTGSESYQITVFNRSVPPPPQASPTQLPTNTYTPIPTSTYTPTPTQTSTATPNPTNTPESQLPFTIGIWDELGYPLINCPGGEGISIYIWVYNRSGGFFGVNAQYKDVNGNYYGGGQTEGFASATIPVYGNVEIVKLVGAGSGILAGSTLEFTGSDWLGNKSNTLVIPPTC